MTVSTYRKFAPMQRVAHDVRTDVYAIETMKAPLVRRLSPQIQLGLDEYKHLRIANPASTPLPRTLKWFESLPPRVRPMALIRQFARIANLIAATWSNREYFETYMESLLTDQRGNRQGFPPDVLAELSALEVYRLAIQDSDLPSADVKRRA